MVSRAWLQGPECMHGLASGRADAGRLHFRRSTSVVDASSGPSIASACALAMVARSLNVVIVPAVNARPIMRRHPRALGLRVDV